jgi:ABC-type cobalamin/Fe3+-siderophores transport system ATPase subunit
LEQVRLENISLYNHRPIIDLEVADGVFCLAGANGLGKSTYLALVTFGLTGTVAPPTVKLQTLGTYYRDARAYADRYFAGRISERDRPSAEVTIGMRVGDVHYSVTRGFFEPLALRNLSVTDASGATLVEVPESTTDEERHQLYEGSLVEHMHIRTYAQYVFLQHFLFSFDERRHLLFWDASATEQVLYLALGLDPELARAADELRKAATGAGSLARNAQYQATTARRRLQQLTQQVTEQSAEADVIERYEELLRRREQTEAERGSTLAALSDAQIELATASAEHMRLRQDYEAAFARRMQPRSQPAQHPLIIQSLTAQRCAVCGTTGDQVISKIQHDLDANACPLCSSDQSTRTQDSGRREGAEELARLDHSLVMASERLDNAQLQIQRLSTDAQRQLAALQQVTDELGRFERESEVAAVVASRQSQGDITAQQRSIESAIEVALASKEEHLARRAELLDRIAPITAQLYQAYQAAETDFVPRFRDLAENFLGLPLQVQLEQGEGPARLILTVEATRRRESAQLSESQRFFIDIALRMALTQQMAEPDSPATLFIDTPEGALDIAYEARAGDLFAAYALAGHQIVMTANINTSQLLTRLARACGADHMQLVRMTEWAELTDVQLQEEQLFQNAYESIESALASGGATSV